MSRRAKETQKANIEEKMEQENKRYQNEEVNKIKERIKAGKQKRTEQHF
jgi:hypothetical protein